MLNQTTEKQFCGSDLILFGIFWLIIEQNFYLLLINKRDIWSKLMKLMVN